MIDGMIFKRLVTHGDERGFFREMIRALDGFFPSVSGQLRHAVNSPGVVKAWHGHRLQEQWFCVLSGCIKVILYDDRPRVAHLPAQHRVPGW